jgi:hypothetical protein
VFKSVSKTQCGIFKNCIIDLCIDISGMNSVKLLEKHPEFFTERGIKKIQNDHKCHFAAIFDSTYIRIDDIEFLKTDRDGKPRGMVLLTLNDIESYDKERQTV